MAVADTTDSPDEAIQPTAPKGPASTPGATPRSGSVSNDVPGPLLRRPWWHRTCSPEERRRIMDDLAIRPV
ncbi:MAG: hypothetical protein OEW83_18760, partial [Acidimicrobiia bacterium]|nr:hypothetical protein [Acidimicrobiia bacterium]